MRLSQQRCQAHDQRVALALWISGANRNKEEQYDDGRPGPSGSRPARDRRPRARQPLTSTEGHLNLNTWNKAGVYVASDAEERYLAACQYRWREVCDEYAAARAAASAHRAQHHW